MTPIEIVRAMLAESGHGDGSSTGDKLLFGYQRALRDVIAALEAALHRVA